MVTEINPKKLFLIFLLLAILQTNSTASLVWDLERTNQTGDTQYSIINTTGDILLTYSYGGLTYFASRNQSTTRWENTSIAVTDNSSVGYPYVQSNSINGFPTILHPQMDGAFKITIYESTWNGTSWNNFELIDSTNVSDVGGEPSFIFNLTTDYPETVYAGDNSSGSRVPKHEYRNDAVWVNQIIEDIPNSGRFPMIKNSTDGLIGATSSGTFNSGGTYYFNNISYHALTGITWNTERIRTDLWTTQDVRPSISWNGSYPIISYGNTSGDAVHTVDYSYFDGLNWFTNSVETTNDIQEYPQTSINIDPNDNFPSIAYVYKTSTPEYYLIYAHYNGTGWEKSIVDNRFDAISPVLSFDKSGMAHITYINNDPGDQLAIYYAKELGSISGDFIGYPALNGTRQLTTAFVINTSGNLVDEYYWQFGDYNTSTDQNPIHTYEPWGQFTVSVIAINSTLGNTTFTKPNYINVTLPATAPVVAPSVGNITTFIKDSDTDTLIIGCSTATLYFGGSYAASNITNNGIAISNISTFGNYIIIGGSSGYASNSTMVTATTNVTNTTLYLTATSKNTNLNSLYPREVRFIIVDKWNRKQPGVNVTAQMISSTIETTNWLSTLFGIPGSATPLNGTKLNGTTDDYGSIAFPMIASGKYELTMTKALAGISETKTVHPTESSYTIIVSTTATAPRDSKSDYIHMNLSVIDGGTEVYLVGIYNDTSSTTSSSYFYINFSNGTVYKTFDLNTDSFSFNKIINNTRGASYVWGINATSSDWGVNHISQGITLNGVSKMLVDPFDATRTGWE